MKLDFKSVPPITFDQARYLGAVKTASRLYMEHIERVYRNAIFDHLGRWPSDEELRTHGHEFVTPDGTSHLAWNYVPVAIGEKADFTKVIATVHPLYRFTPETLRP